MNGKMIVFGVVLICLLAVSFYVNESVTYAEVPEEKENKFVPPNSQAIIDISANAAKILIRGE